MRLLITGGSGYLGNELARQARDLGTWDVSATYASNPPDLPGVTITPLELRDRSSVIKLFAELRPDIVIHTACVQGGAELWPITAEGSGYVAEAAKQVGARLVHISSDAIFDGEKIGLYTEDDPPSPITDYGAAKAEAERLVAAHDPAALIVRTSLIYGGHRPSKHEVTILEALDGKKDMVFFTDEIRCPVQVSDLALALLEVAPAGLGGVLNIAGADAISRYDFARLVVQAAGHSAEGLRSGLSATSGMKRPRNAAMDISRAQNLLQTPLRGVHAVLQ
jgi:dTDP-4-dehydrorhamnose reductase